MEHTEPSYGLWTLVVVNVNLHHVCLQLLQAGQRA